MLCFTKLAVRPEWSARTCNGQYIVCNEAVPQLDCRLSKPFKAGNKTKKKIVFRLDDLGRAVKLYVR